MHSEAKCHACAGPLRGGEAEGLVLAGGVSSDCRPVEGRAEFFQCVDCHLVQPAVGPGWRAEASAIYKAYQTYAAAGGAEQMSVGPAGQGFCRRSDLIVGELERSGLFGQVQSVLDVGCGRGAFLSAFGRRFHGVKLHGYEIDGRNRGEIEALEGGGVFHTGELGDIKLETDVVSLIHVLEHIEDPVEFLRRLRACSSTDGLLVVQVPAWSDNPFALAIRDHASHFTAASLTKVVEAAGWRTVAGPEAWVAKELTLVATHSADVPSIGRPAADVPRERLWEAIAWLRRVAEDARAVAKANERFGIFGTAIAGTWLATQVPEKLAFFVDEDPARLGRRHLGLPIVPLREVGEHEDLYVPLAPVVAAAIRPRLEASCRGRLHFPEA